MNKKLAGIVFMYNAESMDYCYIECIRSMLEVCNVVFVLDAGSTDKTVAYLDETFGLFKNVKIIKLKTSEWEQQHGKEKLAYFTNKAIERAELEGYEYVLNVQADEILSERSHEAIKEAMHTGGEGFMCTRINLWRTPYQYLVVPLNRQPCSTSIIRLAKSKYRSVGDAESLGVNKIIFDFCDKIEIWHMGFVRDFKIMKNKVIHMQEEVFGIDHDVKLDGVDTFKPERWFGGDDLKIIEQPLPTVIKAWAKDRFDKNKYLIGE